MTVTHRRRPDQPWSFLLCGTHAIGELRRFAGAGYRLHAQHRVA